MSDKEPEKILDDPDVRNLSEMDKEQLIKECMRRQKVCENIWMGVTKHFKAHGFSKVLAYVNNRRQQEHALGRNNLGDVWFVFQLDLSKRILTTLKDRKVLGNDRRGDSYVMGLIEGDINKALING